MKLQHKFWLLVGIALATIAWVTGYLLLLVWNKLTPEVQQAILKSMEMEAGFLALSYLLLVIVLLFILNEVFQYYILPLDKLIDESKLIFKLNPGHRIKVSGYREITQLAECFNYSAQSLEELQDKISREEYKQNYSLVQQNKTLVRLINTLPLGIFVCNAQGQILMYNQMINDFFQVEEEAETQICGLLGLGRSVFSLLINFAADEESVEKLNQMQTNIYSNEEFLLMTKNDLLLQGKFFPLQMDDLISDSHLLLLSEKPVVQELKHLKTWRDNIHKKEQLSACEFPLGNRLSFNVDVLDYEQRLEDLFFTVFDTETTGLDPRGGDEIVSIAAVRILNCRIHKEESFNRLINPERDIPEEAVRIHGINNAMVQSQPKIKEVLPCFYSYAKGTVLVAHNSEFDMLMLSLKEEETGIRFDNPVLDIMRLSAFVHPSQEDHTLESIAKRLGVQVQARHTALGDAWTTAEIFVNLLPLLADKGVHTLGQALEADESMSHIH